MGVGVSEQWVPVWVWVIIGGLMCGGSVSMGGCRCGCGCQVDVDAEYKCTYPGMAMWGPCEMCNV